MLYAHVFRSLYLHVYTCSLRDVTAATWGGSSVPSSEEEEEEEGDTTGSLLGAGGLDDTRESLQHSYSATLG